MRTTSRSRVALLCLMTLVVGWSSAAPAWSSPEPQELARVNKAAATPVALPSLPGDLVSEAFAINNQGVVVGVSGNEGGSARATAVAWVTDDEAIPLLPLPGDEESFAYALNNGGQVVGISRSRQGPCSTVTNKTFDTAVIWDLKAGTSTALIPLPGDMEARAYGINNNGVVVGTSLGPRYPNCEAFFTAVMWDRDGNPTALLSPQGAESFATGINERGHVSGGEYLGFGGFPVVPVEQALVWDKDANPSLLDPPAVTWAFGATAINNKGMVTGQNFPGNFSQASVRWNKDGSVSALPPLPGDGRSIPYSINNRGDVAGTSKGGPWTAVVWGRDATPTPFLPLPGGQHSGARGINDRGEVVGFSQAGSIWTAVVWR